MGTKLTAIDLFCGAGGLSEGLRQAGFDVLGAVDVDKLACETYALNHRRTQLWRRDIRRLSGAALMKALGLKPGQLSLLAACPPCQGFSTMRTKNGTRRNRDRRNGLIFDVLRLVRSTKPSAVMIENVPRLAADRRFSAFRIGLRSMGYKIRFSILNASQFGVPQRRRRLVLLASRETTPSFARSAGRARTVRDAIGSLAPPLRSRDPLHNYAYRVKRTERISHLIGQIPRNGGSRKALGPSKQLKCHKKSDGFHDVYGRMAWNRPSPTITGGCINPSKGRFLHPKANRAITLREAALLQTFPKRYRFSLKRGRYAAAMLIGNALPPEFIRRHAFALRKTVSTKKPGRKNGQT